VEEFVKPGAIAAEELYGRTYIKGHCLDFCGDACQCWTMQARLLHLHFRTYDKLRRLKREAEADGAYRVAKRLHAVTLNQDGLSSGEIADFLDAPRSKVSQWLGDYEHFGFEALLEGQCSGRPSQLREPQQVRLEDILDSGPTSWGFLSSVWSAPMVARVISEEFGIDYTARHVRRLLHEWGFSVQRPGRKLKRADPIEQNRWRCYTYPRLKKKPPNRKAS
jgi:transposase